MASGDRRALRPQDLFASLESNSVDFVVIGGFALAPHGYVRATKDVDIVPAPTPDNLARLATALDQLEARVDLADMEQDELGITPDKDGLALGGNWVLQTRYGRLDVMQDVPGMRSYEALRDTAVPVGGVLYAGYEELIRLKLAAGRPEDVRDVGALQAARGNR